MRIIEACELDEVAGARKQPEVIDFIVDFVEWVVRDAERVMMLDAIAS